jgi:AcrR family transcriptional regulator
MVQDVARHGLVDFSLRRAAKAAATTHKVLLYHFSSGDQLLREVLAALPDARLMRTEERAWAAPDASLGDRVHAVFEALLEEGAGPRVLDQATGLALYDPVRYAHLGKDASEQYLPVVLELLPPTWPQDRRQELATHSSSLPSEASLPTYRPAGTTTASRPA